MSFWTNRPANDGISPSAGTVLARKSAPAPAFRPQIARSVRMRPLLAGFVAAVTLGGLVGYALLQKPQYLAESVIYLEPKTPKLVHDSAPETLDSAGAEAFVVEQMQLMRRPDVLAAAIASLPRGTWSDLGPTQQAAVSSLQAQVKVRATTSYQVSIGLTGSDAAKTADIVNAVAASYLEATHKATAAESDVRAQLLSEERERIEGELRAARAEQTAWGASLGAAKPTGAGEVTADIQRMEIREAAVEDTLRWLRMQESGPGQARVALPATAPAGPEPNRTMLLLLLAALPLALLFGAAAAVLARRQDRRIYGAIDVEDLLGFPPLAVLPARADVSERVYEEYVLRLAAGVENAYRNGGARTFLLTAASLTTDIRPLTMALTRKFEEIGVSVAVATASEMLAPTGRVPEADEQQTPKELARTVERWREGFMAANMARLKSGHGLVLIEAEALLSCGQTEYVARCADATILTIESGVTTREELLRAAELLERLNVTGVGAVLEELRLRFADGAFRAAIAALDRRQVAARPAQTRPLEQAVPVAAPQPVAEVAEPRSVAVPVAAEEATGRPMLVEHEVPKVDAEEIFAAEPSIAVANGTTHEKMTMTLPDLRPAPEPVGDATMKPTASWLDRLLRRDAGADFPLVPDEDGMELAETYAPSAAEPEATSRGEYDHPPVKRLEQISRIRPALQGTAFHGSTRGSRLQIVPQELPPELVVERMPALPETSQAMLPAQETPPEAPVENAVASATSELRSQQEWWREGLGGVEPLAAIEEYRGSGEELVLPTPAPVATPAAAARSPRRPLTFQQLERGETAPANDGEPVAEQLPAPLVEVAEVLQKPQPVQEAPVNDVHAVEANVSPKRHQPAPVDAEDEDLEAYDIEPVFQEASQQLTRGRWDPIPTLRPTDNGWRERSMQPPVLTEYGIVDRRRWPRDGDASERGYQRWIPEGTPVPEPVPEPLLSRQWGLLSKFQQARISSGQHPTAKAMSANEPLREPKKDDEERKD